MAGLTLIMLPRSKAQTYRQRSVGLADDRLSCRGGQHADLLSLVVTAQAGVEPGPRRYPPPQLAKSSPVIRSERSNKSSPAFLQHSLSALDARRDALEGKLTCLLVAPYSVCVFRFFAALRIGASVLLGLFVNDLQHYT